MDLFLAWLSGANAICAVANYVMQNRTSGTFNLLVSALSLTVAILNHG